MAMPDCFILINRIYLRMGHEKPLRYVFNECIPEASNTTAAKSISLLGKGFND
jgi:hypothetical protein